MYEWSTNELDWRAKIIDFAQEQINPGAVEREQNGTFDRDVWKACGRLGLTGWIVPEQYGGKASTALSTVRMLESLGYASDDLGLNFGIAAHLLAVVVPILKFGTEDQQGRLLSFLSDGTSIGGNAITERSAGSDVFNMSTKAEFVQGAYQLNGVKTYCSNGKNANLILTYAQTHPNKGFFGGISAFILEGDRTVFKWSDEKSKLGLRSCSLAEVIMQDTLVEPRNRLGEEGAGGPIFNYSMDWERACLGGIHLGAMDRLLELAVTFSNERFAGGYNLSSRQAISHPLANFKIRLEGARLLTYQAAAAIDRGDKRNRFCSLAKVAVSECYRDLCMQLMQVFAGSAYETPNRIETHLRAAIAGTIYSGTSEIHRNLVANDIGLRAKVDKSHE